MNKIADKIVFSLLSKIKHGKINLKNFDGKQFIIGDKSSDLEADLIIKKPGFFLEIINKGSIGLAESYMRDEIETNNKLIPAVRHRKEVIWGISIVKK